MTQPLIFQQFPELSKTVPWLSLGQFPTPVQRLQKLGCALGLPDIWIKRDDLSGERYGGNKVRTLEFILADARAKHAEVIFAYSAAGSTWLLACAFYARAIGVPTDLFCLPYPLDEIKKENLELKRQLARRVYLLKSPVTLPFRLGLELFKARRRAEVYLAPPGGTSPASILAHVNAVLELKQQCDRGDMPVPDVIYCPFGSGGTAAGLAIGLHLVGWPTRLAPVRVTDFLLANKLRLKYLISRTVRLMRQHGAHLPAGVNWGANIRVEHSFCGRGYGRPTPACKECIELLRTCEDMQLDGTYTGKTFAALLAAAKRAEMRGKTILFWNTLNSRKLSELLARSQVSDTQKTRRDAKRS